MTFRHESGSPEFKVQGFFDGDGKGGIEGDVFKVRFCPTQPGKWTLTECDVELAMNSPVSIKAIMSWRRRRCCTDSGWRMKTSPEQRWYRRSDGSHQYIFGNTHYTFLTEHGPSGKPTGGHIADDMAANAKYFKKVRFGLQNGQYPHPTEKPWLDDAGQPTDDGNFSHRPNPRWFHRARRSGRAQRRSSTI